MSAEERRQQAMEQIGRAYQAQMRGELAEAIALYTESLELCPTPEAYTYRGWARSFLRDFEGAIADCQQAIDLDPEFGNPYNDIGAYCIEMGQVEDAIPWLRMALKAVRYESYCYPHYNLGRVYEGMSRPGLALEHYRAALAENPAYGPAQRAVQRLEAGRPPHSGA